MTSAPRTGAIVLAGGRSRRFGRDKLAEPVDGRPLLDRAIAAVLAVVDARDVVVVAGPDSTPTVPDGIRVAHDAVAGEGPLAGLVAGLSDLDQGVDRVLVVGGDMPDLVPAVLAALVAALDLADGALLETGDRVRALPMGVRRDAALTTARAQFATGERRLRAVPLALGATIVPAATWRASDPAGATLRDIDTQGDLARR